MLASGPGVAVTVMNSAAVVALHNLQKIKLDTTLAWIDETISRSHLLLRSSGQW